jgi:enoyl-CoA hydratase/carnithine racemase
MKIQESRHDEFLTCEVREGIAVVTLGQGALDITISLTSRDNFLALISEVERMDEVRALLIINSSAYPGVEGQRLFFDALTGGDDTSHAERERLLSVEEHARYRILMKLMDFRKPVVGAMQGEIASPFFGISLAFPLRLAAEDMSVVFPRKEYDFPPGWPLGLFLPRYVGQGRAAEMMLSGRPVQAATLLEMGLIHEVCGADSFVARCIERTMELCRRSGHRVSEINRMLSPDPAEISNCFNESMTIMKRALHSALN